MEVRPSHMLLVRRADVLVRNGLEEDAWIDVIVRGSNNPKVQRGSPNVIDASLGVEILKVPTGRVDRSLGDVHSTGNPHYTLDPANLPTVTRNIVAGLARAAPEHTRIFEANREAFLEKVAEADRRWRALLAPFRGARIVSHHDSWPYLFRAFGFVEGGIIEDRPGIPPSPQHLAGLVRRMRDEKVRVILLENWYAADAASLVARETGAKVLVVPQTPGAVKGSDDDVLHLDRLQAGRVRALRGRAREARGPVRGTAPDHEGAVDGRARQLQGPLLHGRRSARAPARSAAAPTPLDRRLGRPHAQARRHARGQLDPRPDRRP